MITRSNLAEQLREYQIRSKHDWASVSFFSSTSNLTSSRYLFTLFDSHGGGGGEAPIDSSRKRLAVGLEDRVSRFRGASFGALVFPTKVGFFAWEASWRKVLTLDQLKRRGWNLANRCFLCCAEEEMINHILIHCSKARVLWELVFALFGVNWVLPLLARDTLLANLGLQCVHQAWAGDGNEQVILMVDVVVFVIWELVILAFLLIKVVHLIIQDAALAEQQWLRSRASPSMDLSQDWAGLRHQTLLATSWSPSRSVAMLWALAKGIYMGLEEVDFNAHGHDAPYCSGDQEDT
ncbi:hypothetical protein CK203_071256 [Vitis vinifera]|uniref:Reverse transcriptase zinc-binding domain-containing protein n=3 Tax=Pentapetalae TaxID=1437201 RepID=A0A438ETA7_VITVI|nr:hypothetical protein CK203_071256 [Vitis vinifera]